jgi:hypothetical protein
MDQTTSTPSDEPSPKPSGEVLDELRELGRNLRALLQSAWESDERKKLQGEIETGLNELFSNLSQAAQDFSASPTGQTLKSDIEDLSQRIKTGEVETKVRAEVLNALRAANEGLKNASTPKPPPPPQGEA